jgi:hypothetical protein
MLARHPPVTDPTYPPMTGMRIDAAFQVVLKSHFVASEVETLTYV